MCCRCLNCCLSKAELFIFPIAFTPFELPLWVSSTNNRTVIQVRLSGHYNPRLICHPVLQITAPRCLSRPPIVPILMPYVRLRHNLLWAGRLRAIWLLSLPSVTALLHSFLFTASKAISLKGEINDVASHSAKDPNIIHVLQGTTSWSLYWLSFMVCHFLLRCCDSSTPVFDPRLCISCLFFWFWISWYSLTIMAILLPYPFQQVLLLRGLTTT